MVNDLGRDKDMKKIVKFLAGIGAGAFLLGFLVNEVEKKKEKKADSAEKKCNLQRNRKTEGNWTYRRYEEEFKRPLDFAIALIALLFLSPVLVILALMVRVKLGKPAIFIQERPGKGERIFKLYKFRTMTDQRDANGKLLPDEKRLSEFGKKLRLTSLDELPELFNILRGDMSLVGPRPQLVRDMVFMTKEQRMRHTVRPGLSGLAQISGRNSISWEEKLELDLKYLERITFLNDMKIIFNTIGKVFRREGIQAEGMETSEDLGDYLLRVGKISQREYEKNQAEAEYLLKAAGM